VPSANEDVMSCGEHPALEAVRRVWLPTYH
jgi:hypothetical protein